ncbi:hypothetical protein [Microvirga roseola]|uniref:hypothetical protein n=1 Tax=Microvirga roseola TaxID=2883126 RepID=UPI001E5DB759|nr:hypothetical protein [Microvirga roseola]
MFDPLFQAGYIPQAYVAPSVAQAALRTEAVEVAAGTEREGSARGQQMDPVAISRVLLNAESLIAAMLGVRAHEVSVNVTISRYGG